VDFSNLQRQIAHGTEDVGRRKPNRPRHDQKINPNVEVVIHNERIAATTRRHPFVPTTSSWTARTTSRPAILTNDACVILKKANVYGSIFRFEGQASVFAAAPRRGACYPDVFYPSAAAGWFRVARKAGARRVARIVGCIRRPRF